MGRAESDPGPPTPVPFRTGRHLSLKRIRRKQMHIFCGPLIGNKGHQATVAVPGQGQPGLPFASRSRHSPPGSLCPRTCRRSQSTYRGSDHVPFFHPVQHQILLPSLDIAERCVDHRAHSSHNFCPYHNTPQFGLQGAAKHFFPPFRIGYAIHLTKQEAAQNGLFYLSLPPRNSTPTSTTATKNIT